MPIFHLTVKVVFGLMGLAKVDAGSSAGQTLCHGKSGKSGMIYSL
jgi:hypothetical protein